MNAVDVLDAELSGMAPPTLAAIQALSAELNTALGTGKEWGAQIAAATFVAASRDLGCTIVVVVGCTGGWRSVQVPDDGRPVVSEPFLTAGEAVASLTGTP